MGKINQQKITLRSPTTSLNVCPVSNIPFWGDCPNASCPANISQINPGSGGCFLTTGKPALVDVAHSLRITTQEVKRRYRKGLRNIDKFLQFYQWLTNQRELNKIKPHCPNCGVTNEHGLMCINKLRCKRRQTFYQRSLKRYPLRINILAISAYELWAIVAAQQAGKITVLSRKRFRRANSLLSLLANSNQEKTDGVS